MSDMQDRVGNGPREDCIDAPGEGADGEASREGGRKVTDVVVRNAELLLQRADD